jgi:hypothetical protein
MHFFCSSDRRALSLQMIETWKAYAMRRIILDKAEWGYGFNLGLQLREHRSDREIVIAAVRRDGRNLQYAPYHLQDDLEVVMASLRYQNYSGYKFASPMLKRNEQVINSAVRGCSSVLLEMDEDLQNDIELVELAIDCHFDAIINLQPIFQENYDVNLRAARQNYRAYKYMSMKFQLDANIALAAARHMTLEKNRTSESITKRAFEEMSAFWNVDLQVSLFPAGRGAVSSDFGQVVLNCIAVPGETAMVFSIFDLEENENGLKLSATTMSNSQTFTRTFKEGSTLGHLAKWLADSSDLKFVYIAFGDQSVTPFEGDKKIMHFAPAKTQTPDAG